MPAIRGLLLSLFLICNLFAQAPDSAPLVAADHGDQQKGTISGVVTDAFSGQPLKKATVLFSNTKSNGRSEAPAAVITGADGRYSLTLDPGEYRLSASRNGYVRQAYGQKDSRRPGIVLTLSSKQEMKNIDFRLTPGGVISGRVIDEDGEPMSGVTVSALRAMYQNGERRLVPAGGGTRTDDRGEYRIFGLFPRRYYVNAVRRGFAEFMGSDVRPNESFGGMSQPSEGYAPNYYPGTSDANAAAPVEVSAGQEQRINFTLVPSRAYTVIGTVLDSSGQPVKQGFANLMAKSSGMFGPAAAFSQIQNGKLLIKGVVSGSYVLTVGLLDDEAELAQREINVADQDVTNLMITVTPGGQIQGTVRFVDFAGPQPDLNVYLMPKNFSGSFGRMANATVKEGSFTLKNVFPEDYVTNVNNLPPTAYVKSVRVGGEETLTTGFNGGKGTTMEIVVSGRASSIEGTVTGSNGKPHPGATVILTSEQPIWVRQGVVTTSTDQNGHFIFRGLRPANYSIGAWEAIDDEEYSDPDFAKRYDRVLANIKLEEGEAKTKNLDLLGSDQRLAASE